MPKKGGLGQFADLRWGLGKKWGMFLRGLIPQCTLFATLEFLRVTKFHAPTRLSDLLHDFALANNASDRPCLWIESDIPSIPFSFWTLKRETAISLDQCSGTSVNK